MPFKGGTEHKLFQKILQSHGGCDSSPDYARMLNEWRTKVDGRKIMPKAECHFRKMLKIWEKVLQRKQICKNFKASFKDVQDFFKSSNEQMDYSFFDFTECDDDIEVQIDAFMMSRHL